MHAWQREKVDYFLLFSQKPDTQDYLRSPQSGFFQFEDYSKAISMHPPTHEFPLWYLVHY